MSFADTEVFVCLPYDEDNDAVSIAYCSLNGVTRSFAPPPAGIPISPDSRGWKGWHRTDIRCVLRFPSTDVFALCWTTLEETQDLFLLWVDRPTNTVVHTEQCDAFLVGNSGRQFFATRITRTDDEPIYEDFQILENGASPNMVIPLQVRRELGWHKATWGGFRYPLPFNFNDDDPSNDGDAIIAVSPGNVRVEFVHQGLTRDDWNYQFSVPPNQTSQWMGTPATTPARVSAVGQDALLYPIYFASEAPFEFGFWTDFENSVEVLV